MSDHLAALGDSIAPARKQLLDHPIYAALDSPAAVVTFMGYHVWAVWDFMTLLTSLQRWLTCVEMPWLPKGPPSLRRLVNEIKLDEESDRVGDGYASHFELYLAAMAEAGADSRAVERFTGLLGSGSGIATAIFQATAPPAAEAFVWHTWDLTRAPLPAQAAGFAFGREDVIPDMFEQVALLHAGGHPLGLFADYLRRHVELDAEHGELAREMVAQVCGDDPAAWAMAEAAALGAITARLALWDGTLQAIGA